MSIERYITCRMPINVDKVWIPDNESTLIDEVNGLKFNRLFITEVDVSVPKNLDYPIICRHEGDDRYYDLEDIKRGRYNSVDLNRAITGGYRVTKIYKIMTFTEEIKSLDRNALLEINKNVSRDGANINTKHQQLEQLFHITYNRFPEYHSFLLAYARIV